MNSQENRFPIEEPPRSLARPAIADATHYGLKDRRTDTPPLFVNSPLALLRAASFGTLSSFTEALHAMLSKERRRTASLLSSLLVLAWLLCGSAQAQNIYGYHFESGTNPAEWVFLNDYHTVDSTTTPLFDLGFDFYFFGNSYRQISINRQGAIRFENIYGIIHNSPITPFSAASMMMRPPFILPYGISLLYAPDSYARYQVIGFPGNRTLVCEFLLSSNADTTAPSDCKFQVHLREANGSVTMVYLSDIATARYTQIGMALNIGNRIVVDVANETVLANPNGWSNLWPGQYHYYRFTPTSQPVCAKPTHLYIRHLTPTSAEIEWRHHAADQYYQFTLVETDTEMPVATLSTTDTVLVIENLSPETKYTARVVTTCSNGNSSQPATATFTTPCLHQDHNQIEYQNLYSADVECWYGSFDEPSRTYGVMDFGQHNSNSRHTICTEQNQYDEYTNRHLRTIPEGSCYSVRLGNDLTGAEQEEIIYTIKVDTLDYNILVLRYAIVEEDPSHPAGAQPRFEIDICDSNGNSLNPCYHTNFVAGDLSGWNRIHNDHNIVWLDWSAVGLDLTPLHNQTIKVKLNNYDCSGGGHFGYSYFTLATYNKYLTSTNCDGIDSATFEAPLGFRYRWYPATDTSLTLSEEQSLTVSQPGTYYCNLRFGPDNTECGFTLATYFGAKYPTAQFAIEPLDDCGRRVRFINQSCISRNASHTDLTPYPCESYLWRFDDGTTSTLPNPIHYFDEGDHTITLVAMLANGDCADSVQHTLHVEKSEEVTYDSICHGQRYRFFDRWLTDSGTYTAEDNCTHHTLHLHTYYAAAEESYDTICHGESRSWRGLICDTTGLYTTVVHLDNNGCDSAYRLHLNVLENPQIASNIRHTCVGDAYYYLYLPDSFACSWTSIPANAPQPYFSEDSLGNPILCIKPNSLATYILRYEAQDRFGCSSNDTLELTPVQDILARMEVSPTIITNSTQELNAKDFSLNADGRHWLIDGALQEEEGPELQTDVTRVQDSLVLTLIAYNSSCQDTTSETIFVKRHSLFFPNVFTPAQHSNNLFQPITHGITEYEIWIYDRRGTMVFHSTDSCHPWDGTTDGRPCPQGAYAYRVLYRTIEGDRLSENGTVTLLR